jgi:hypothetical protein
MAPVISRPIRLGSGTVARHTIAAQAKSSVAVAQQNQQQQTPVLRSVPGRGVPALHAAVNPFGGFNQRLVARLLRTSGSTSRMGSLSGCATAATAVEPMPARRGGGMLKVVEVGLGERTYPIYIGSGLLTSRGELLRKHIPGQRVLIVTNETIAPLYLEK